MKRTYLMIIMALCAGAHIQAMNEVESGSTKRITVAKVKPTKIDREAGLGIQTEITVRRRLSTAKTGLMGQRFSEKGFTIPPRTFEKSDAEIQTDTDIVVKGLSAGSTKQQSFLKKWFFKPSYIKPGLAIGLAAAVGYCYANDIRYAINSIRYEIKSDMNGVMNTVGRGIARVSSGIFDYVEHFCHNYPTMVALMLGLGSASTLPGNLTHNNTYTVVTNNNKEASDYGFKKIVGGVPQEIKQIAEMLQGDADTKQRYAQFNIPYPKGILLYGPPGTGKTLLAKAIAEEIKCPFIETNASQFLTVWQGSGAANVEELFKTAQRAAARDKSGKAIIFIDEIDAVGSREQGLHHEAKKVLNTLLTTMDGFKTDDSVIVIGATNSMESLDEALIRAGRFGKKIEIGLPDRAKRQALLEHYSADRPISIAVSFETMANRLDGCSAADMKEIVNAAAGIALAKGAEYITQDAFNQAIKNVKKDKNDGAYQRMYI